jgi:hypothetical protein
VAAWDVLRDFLDLFTGKALAGEGSCCIKADLCTRTDQACRCL